MASPPQQIRVLAGTPTRKMFALVYEELRELAKRYLAKERADHTLQPTALVHEAYLRLSQQRELHWDNRQQFFAVAATAIRRILVNHAKARLTSKRGGDRDRIALDDALAWTGPVDVDLLALDEALEKLVQLDERQCRIVELLFFGGLTIDTVAEIVGVSPRTVDGEWAMARSWLRAEMTR